MTPRSHHLTRFDLPLTPALMTSLAPDSELYSIESRFEGPCSTERGHQVVISVVLEPGTESHFSGIQIVVCCREDNPRLHKLVGVFG